MIKPIEATERRPSSRRPEDDGNLLFYAALGPLAAIVLGVALIPLREATPASNLAFPFIILILVIAELGGGWAVLATAIVSSLSLDFFLTQPYLTLAMTGKHDLYAFLGLTACGLTSAALASRRRTSIARLKASLRDHS